MAPRHRLRLLSLLSSGDIQRLWKVAGQRYTAPRQQVAAALGPDDAAGGAWRDLPSGAAAAAAGQLSVFRGKAALPTHVLGVSSFSKAFFLAPRGSSSGTSGGDDDSLYGRVLLHKGPLGDWLYPLYFKATVAPAVVPSESPPPPPVRCRAA